MSRLSQTIGLAAVLWALGGAMARPARAQEAAATAESMKPYTETIPGTELKFEMLPIPGGTFEMGSPPGEAKRGEEEGPQHPVQVGPFWMGKFEVTWEEYDHFAFSLDLKKKTRENVDLTKQPETEKKADAVTRPTPPYADETFGHGRNGQPIICVFHHAAKLPRSGASDPRNAVDPDTGHAAPKPAPPPDAGTPQQNMQSLPSSPVDPQNRTFPPR